MTFSVRIDETQIVPSDPGGGVDRVELQFADGRVASFDILPGSFSRDASTQDGPWRMGFTLRCFVRSGRRYTSGAVEAAVTFSCRFAVRSGKAVIENIALDGYTHRRK